MARLASIHIKNYRSIKDSGEIPITKLFALVGKNNTGKSSFLKATRVLFGELDIADSDFHKDTSDAIEVIGIIKKWEDEKEVEMKVRVFRKRGLDAEYYIDDGKKTAKAAHAKVLPALLIIPDRRDATEFSTAGQRTTLLKRILAERRKTDAEELDRISRQLEEAKRKEAEEVSALLTTKFRDIAQEKTFDVKIEPDVEVDKSTTHESAFVDTGIPNAPTIGVTESGTGLQSMYLLTLLDVYGDISGRSEDGILLIEEPEVYLHPEYQRRMFTAMRKIAGENQVIFSTHSPIMVSQIWVTEDAPSVRQVRLETGETKIEPVQVEQIISELGIKYEDVLNPSLTIFVEGDNDVLFYEKLGIVGSQLKYIPTENFRAMDYFAYMKIISSANVSSKFVVITDGDGERQDVRKEELRSVAVKKLSTASEKLATRLSEDGVIHVLGKYEIESYFVNQRTLKTAFPDIPESEIEQFVAHYESIYAEEFANVHDSGNPRTKEQFQNYAKPKLLFTRSERKNHSSSSFESAYNDFWRNDATFMKVRDSIIAANEQMRLSGIRWFDHLLEIADLSAYPELVEMKDSIMKLA